MPGLADPVQLTSARAQIDGARVVLDQMEAQAGKVAVTGIPLRAGGAAPAPCPAADARVGCGAIWKRN